MILVIECVKCRKKSDTSISRHDQQKIKKHEMGKEEEKG